MRGGWMMLAVMTLAACGADGETPEIAEQDSVQRDSPVRPPSAQAEGNYALITAGGATLPAPVDADATTAGCTVEVINGSVRLAAGRFAWQNETREVCNGRASGDPTMNAAGGTYTIDGNRIVLRTDVGEAFEEATGTIDQNSLTIERLGTGENARDVVWVLRRDDPALVPVPGTADGAVEGREGEMSELPVTSGR